MWSIKTRLIVSRDAVLLGEAGAGIPADCDSLGAGSGGYEEGANGDDITFGPEGDDTPAWAW